MSNSESVINQELENLRKENENLKIEVEDLKKQSIDFGFYWMQNQNNLINLLIDLSLKFINLPVQNIDSEINLALERIGRFVNVDRVYICEYFFDQKTGSNTYEWCNKGIQPYIHELQNLPLENFKFFVDNHLKGEIVYIRDKSEIMDNQLRSIMDEEKIDSLLAIPLIGQNSCLGLLGFDMTLYKHHFSKQEKQIFRVFAQMIVNLKNRWLANEKIKTQIALQRLVNEISTEMISADNNSIDAKIMSLLSKTGEFFEMDRSYIMRYDQDCVLESITHEWCAPGVNPEKESIRNVNIGQFPWWEKQVKSNSIISVPFVE